MFMRIFDWLGKIPVRRVGQVLAILASAISLLLYAVKPAGLAYLDVRARDMVYLLREVPSPPANVVVVAVDEKSVKEYGRWPWSRHIQARLLLRLKELGVRVIALDIDYLLPESQQADQALREALQAPGADVVGGYYFVNEQTIAPSVASLEHLADSAIYNLWEPPGSRADLLLQYPYVEANQPDLAPYFQGFGYFNAEPDEDGLLRSTPMVVVYEEEFYPSLPLKALSLYRDHPIHLGFDQEGLAELRLGDAVLPVDSQGRIVLNFYDSATDFRTPVVSVADVLAAKPKDLGHLRGALVFVGVTETVLADVRPTPTDPNFPGVKAHSTVAGNILQHDYILTEPGIFLDVVLIGLFPLLVIWSMTWVRRLFWMVLIFCSEFALLRFGSSPG